MKMEKKQQQKTTFYEIASIFWVVAANIDSIELAGWKETNNLNFSLPPEI